MIENGNFKKDKEVIVGMHRDATALDPMMMFGMGGTMVELFTKDIAFKLCHFRAGISLAMINETIAGRLLKGSEAQNPLTWKQLWIIAGLSQLAIDDPEISEIEINHIVCGKVRCYGD